MILSDREIKAALEHGFIKSYFSLSTFMMGLPFLHRVRATMLHRE